MPSIWDEALQKQLLLAVAYLSPATAPPDWDKVAILLGGTVNGNGCMQFFNKMKRNCKSDFDKVFEGGGSSGETSAPKTPAKGKGKKTAGEKSGGKRKAVEKVVDEADDEESPTKKVKEVEEEDVLRQ